MSIDMFFIFLEGYNQFYSETFLFYVIITDVEKKSLSSLVFLLCVDHSVFFFINKILSTNIPGQLPIK